MIRIGLHPRSQHQVDSEMTTIMNTAQTDLSPPESIPCAQFEEFCLECNFMSSDCRQNRWDMSPTFQQKDITTSQTLLEYPSKLLLASCAASTYRKLLNTDEEDPTLGSLIRPQVRNDTITKEADSSVLAPPISRRQRGGENHKTQSLPTAKQRVVREWIQTNSEHPFPSSSQRAQLIRESGYSSGESNFQITLITLTNNC